MSAHKTNIDSFQTLESNIDGEITFTETSQERTLPNNRQNEPVAVEQARKIVKLDRAMVYQFDDDWNGNIVAESLVTGYPRGLNAQIKDPCFAKEYGEKYRQGRIKAIANIHQADLTKCHLEQLQSLAVKASLIVPILQDDQF